MFTEDSNYVILGNLEYLIGRNHRFTEDFSKFNQYVDTYNSTMNLKERFNRNELDVYTLSNIGDYQRITSLTNCANILFGKINGANIRYTHPAGESETDWIINSINYSIKTLECNQLITFYIESLHYVDEGYFANHFDALTDYEFIILIGMWEKGDSMTDYKLNYLLFTYLILKDRIDLITYCNVLTELLETQDDTPYYNIMKKEEDYTKYLNLLTPHLGIEEYSIEQVRNFIDNLVRKQLSKVPFMQIKMAVEGFDKVDK